MATFIRRHSFAVAACAAVIGGFGYFCAKYVPLYRAYHVNHDISDETVFHGGGGGNCGGGGLVNGTADVTPRPSIRSPIAFLVVNFVYSYAVLVIVVRLYGLYTWTATTISGLTMMPSGRTCCGGYHEIGTNPEPAEPDETGPKEPVVAKLAVARTTDDRRPRVGHRVPVVRTSRVSSGGRSWDGDWNKYWNDKPDF